MNAESIPIGIEKGEKREGVLSRVQKRVVQIQLKRAKSTLADYKRDLRDAQAQMTPNPSREQSDKAIIERLEREIAELEAKLR